MQLMIPVPLILPDAPLTLDALEEAGHGWGSPSSKPLSPARGRAQAALRPAVPCPACHGARRQRAGSRVRTAETGLGGAVAAQHDREATAACQPPATALAPAIPPASVAVVLIRCVGA